MTTLQVAAKPAYLDTCAEQWLISQGKAPILVSHWLLVDFAGVVALPFTANSIASAANACNSWNPAGAISSRPRPGCSTAAALPCAAPMPFTWRLPSANSSPSPRLIPP